MSQKRTLVLLIALAVLILSACGGGGSDVVKRPVVRLQVGDQTYAENVYSYCWPESAENIACDIDETALVQPIKNVPVSKGDEVHFVIEGEAGPPDKFTATLLDGPGGVQDLNASSGVYDVTLLDDLYRVQVDAEYNSVEGKPAYASYVFGLQVAGIVVPTPTPVPTDTPTATATPTLTPMPTATNTPEPTATPTATNTPEPVVTDTPTIGAVETEASPPAVVPGAETVTVQPVVSPTESPVVIQVTPTTETAVQPGTTPATIAPTVPPPPAVTPTPLPSAPALKLRFAGRDYTPVGYQFCQRAPSGERVCVELPATDPSLGRISLQRGAAAQIAIDGPRPSEVRIEYLSDDGIPTGQPETRLGDNTILLTITPEPGTYILSIRVTWATEDVTYFFRVSVSN